MLDVDLMQRLDAMIIAIAAFGAIQKWMKLFFCV